MILHLTQTASPASGVTPRQDAMGYRKGLAAMGICASLSVSLAELTVSPVVPAFLTVAVICAAMLSMNARRSAARGLLPKPLISIASLTGFILAFCEIAVWSTPAVLALSHFFVLIVALKLVDRTAARDDAELLVTSLFLMVIAGIISGQVIFALLIALYLWFGVRTLVQFHIKCELERINSISRAAAGDQRPVFVALQTEFTGRLGGVTYRTIGIATATGVLVFLLCPRMGPGLLGRAAAPLAMSVTGFSEKMQFGDMSDIKRNERVVMRVQLLQNGESVGSPDFQPYYRGMTLDLYDGHEWRARDESTRPEPRQNARAGMPLIEDYRPDARDGLLEQRIWLSNPASRYLFACYVPYEIDFDPSLTIRVRRSDWTMRLGGTQILGPVVYSVQSLTRVTPRLASSLKPGPSPPWFFDDRRRRREPEIGQVVTERVRNYTANVIAGLPPPTDSGSRQAIADSIEHHLSSGGFSYSLERSDVDRSREATEDFLLHRKRGHCEYFASAMAVMCQLSGVPARIVNGYRGGQWNSTGDYYLVTEADAHSWVEVELDESDWVTYDPTPGSVNAQRDTDSLWSTLRGIGTHVQVLWVDRVVSYSAANREVLLANFGDWLAELGKQKDLWSEIMYFANELLFGPAALAWYYRLMYWSVIVLCLIALYMALRMFARPARLWWRWVTRVTSRAPGRPRQESFYTRTIDLLTVMGFAKTESSTPLEHMSQLARLEPRFARLPEIARAFYQVHFGGQPMGPAQRRRIEEIIAALANPSPSR